MARKVANGECLDCHEIWPKNEMVQFEIPTRRNYISRSGGGMSISYKTGWRCPKCAERWAVADAQNRREGNFAAIVFLTTLGALGFALWIWGKYFSH